MAPMTNADESPNESPDAFSYLPVSLYSIYSLPVLPRNVDFGEGGKLEYPEKNPRSTGEINYENSNSHGIPHQTWFQWSQAQRANRLGHPFIIHILTESFSSEYE